ncbi:MAG: hypothetical protein HY001_05635 [Candidatus Portnoybacteria bacterium]|nr:hypothetical protein [Candidatus Portnoybacteria bacterium]
MPWCFAIVNGRLAEIYFHERKRGMQISAHCYVKREEYRTKQEQKWIEKDTEKFRFVYREEGYKRIFKVS